MVLKRNYQGNFKKWYPATLNISFFLENIIDPEMPKTLKQLKIISIEGIILERFVNYPHLILRFWVIPTVNNCSLSSLIGIFIQNIVFQRSVSEFIDTSFPKNWNWKFFIEIPIFSHFQGSSYTKQINDKERVSAAFENEGIRKMIEICYKKNCKKTYT
jgi:hypothetical protein